MDQLRGFISCCFDPPCSGPLGLMFIYFVLLVVVPIALMCVAFGVYYLVQTVRGVDVKLVKKKK